MGKKDDLIIKTEKVKVKKSNERKQVNLDKKVHKENKKKRKVDQNGNQTTVKVRFGVRGKLLLSFSLLIVLILVLGITCYNTAADPFISNYETSSSNTVNAMSMYVDKMLEDIQAKTEQIANNEDVWRYFGDVDKIKETEAFALHKKIKSYMNTIKLSDPNIINYHIISELCTVESSVGTFTEDIYASFATTSEGVMFLGENPVKSMWLGSHPELDALLGISSDSYGLAYGRKLVKGKGVIWFDVSSESIYKALEGIRISENSIVGFVTSDGRETTIDRDGKLSTDTQVFTSETFFETSAASESIEGFSYESYNGKEYLYLYSKIGESDAMLCSLVPKEDITVQLNDIRGATITIVVVAVILALVIATIISQNIGGAIKRISKSLEKVAEGDLTVKLQVRRKDEFIILSSSINYMMENIKRLIGKMSEVGSFIEEKSEDLSEHTNEVHNGMQNISDTINRMQQGSQLQALDSEKCSGRMSELSQKIYEVGISNTSISEVANETQDMVKEGIQYVEELNEKTNQTVAITDTVMEEISQLEQKSMEIVSFVNIINDIAEQTNLLSLNASIEAARAGEMGRGFGVVANEISKLADQTVHASMQISKIVEGIRCNTESSVTSVKKAGIIVKSQESSLKNMIQAFQDMNCSIENLIENLSIISNGVEDIEKRKQETMESVNNIAQVAEESAAFSVNISSTVSKQTDIIAALSEEAKELHHYARELEREITSFKIT